MTSLDSAAAGRARSVGLKARRARIAVAQKRVDQATERYQAAESRQLALQAARASAKRVAAAKAHTIALAHVLREAREDLSTAKARKARSLSAELAAVTRDLDASP